MNLKARHFVLDENGNKVEVDPKKIKEKSCKVEEKVDGPGLDYEKEYQILMSENKRLKRIIIAYKEVVKNLSLIEIERI